jgi:hypothetical protein
MKKLAHKYNSFESDIITVDDALFLKKKFPDDWETRDFYDIIKLRPMFPVDRKGNSSSFTFRNSQGGGHGKGSKGIAHELVQEYLCKREQYSFKVYGTEIDLKIANAFDEWHVFDPSNNVRKAYIDCCLELSPDCEWYEKLGPKVGFEITDTHKTGYRKRKLLEELGIFVFEIVTIRDWHISSDSKPRKEDIYKLRARIKGYLDSLQRVEVLSKPSYIG